MTIVVPFAPGGSTDIVSRLLAERMTQILGQPVQVENRPGGNTIVGAEHVARSRPDGHTALMAAGTTLTINPVIVPNLPYKVEDFAPVMLATTFPFGIITRLNGGPVDVPAWVAAARARPGQMTYGTNGPTTLTNVAMLMCLQRLGITMQDVTYRGDSAQLAAFLAGDLDMLIVAGGTAQPVHRNRQGRLIAWTSGAARGEHAGGAFHRRIRPGARGAVLVRAAVPGADAGGDHPPHQHRGERGASGPAHPRAPDDRGPVPRRRQPAGFHGLPAQVRHRLAADPVAAERAPDLEQIPFAPIRANG
jgi:hypothetical protein